MGDHVAHLVLSSDSVCLEGQVIVCDRGVFALDGLECLVCEVLHGVGDLHEHGLLCRAQVLAGALCDSLHLGLACLDGCDDLLLHVCCHSRVLFANECAVVLGCL